MEQPAWDRIADFLFEVGQLSRTPRSGYALLRLTEQNVADHSFRVAMIALTLARLSPPTDCGRILAMSLVHDLSETRTLDLNALTKEYVATNRSRVIQDQSTGLPFGEELRLLVEEYEGGASTEAKLVHDADRIELLLALRERTMAGSNVDQGWIERARGRLQTEVGRHLADALLAADPDRWWKH